MPCTIIVGFHRTYSTVSRFIFVMKHYDYYEYGVYEVYEKQTSKSMQNTYELSHKNEVDHSEKVWLCRNTYGERAGITS